MSSPKALEEPNLINVRHDLVVIGKEVRYTTHRIAFLCVSPYFQTLFRYNSVRDSNGFYRLHLTDVSTQVLKQIHNYASYGRADVTEDNVIELLIASDKYNIKAIVQSCEQFLRQTLDSNNCFQTYLLSHYYNCEDLKKFVANYIISNNIIVGHSDEELSVDTILEICHNSTP